MVDRREQEFVIVDDHEFGLGLLMPDEKTLAFPKLEEKPGLELLDFDAIRKIIESEDFSFGQKMFDTSWITNQNGYGSCAGYGAASALAKARVLGGQPRVDLSGDYAYSKVNGGRDRGSMLDANMRSITKNGVATAETVPLGGIYPSKYDRAKADAEAQRFRAHECFAITDEKSMATALVNRFPVVIAIHVTRSWQSFDADDILAPARGPGNHCEHVDDIKWSARRGCFLYRKATSHGKRYSGDGYCWTTWKDHYHHTIKNHVFYAVPSAIYDPELPKPLG